MRWTISISWSLLSSHLNLRHPGEDVVNVQGTTTSALADDHCTGHSEYYVCFSLARSSGISWIETVRMHDLLWKCAVDSFYAFWTLHFAVGRWFRFFNLCISAHNMSLIFWGKRQHSYTRTHGHNRYVRKIQCQNNSVECTAATGYRFGLVAILATYIHTTISSPVSVWVWLGMIVCQCEN